MTQFWTKLSEDQIKRKVFKALEQNISYVNENILGVPASYLDEKVFNQDASFLKEAPFISSLVQNPNHIGCHTRGGQSESFFAGTQQIERELIEICAVDILKAKSNTTDGYVASGGTEANLQAIWIYRNYFLQKFNAKLDEICILCSDDSHYSVDKAANVFVLDIYKTAVKEDTRSISPAGIRETIEEAKQEGKKYFIVISNMMTTMFGSVDNPDFYINELTDMGVSFKLHVDGAFGGFYYPFSNEESWINFENEHISSFTLDGHKMAQAPYGTGIFLIRKGMMDYTHTKSASYVAGEDFTLIGSRSGANAIAVWMILAKNGPYGWKEKIFILQKRAKWLCDELEALKINYYRHKFSNIITIDSKFVDEETVEAFGLVPDNHESPNWYKVVVMDHVSIENLMELIKSINSKLSPQ